MGLLDVDDSAVKNHLLYQKCVSAQTELRSRIESFKSKGATSSLAKDLGQGIKGLLDSVERAEKQFPDFGEWAGMRAEGLKVAKVLCDRFPTASDLDSLGLRALVKDHPAEDKGLLVPDAAAVKNHLKYKEAVSARENLATELASFKTKGGTSTVAGSVASATLRLLRAADDGARTFPEFEEWPSFRKDALEMATALCAKFPTNSSLSSLKAFVDDPNKRAV